MSKKRESGAAPTAVKVSVDASKRGAPLALDRYALGQGGLSDGPMMEPHVEALRWLKPRVIRLFVQEYYNVYPAHGKYHWDSLDRAVKSIIDTGAKPLMSICIKPCALYPQIDQDKVHPSDYDEWESVIEAMVRRYNGELGCGIEYWEVFNEPDIGETGGCPGRFTPEDYCTYYTHTVSAVRRADPKAKVGGPALASYKSPLLRALVEHCAAGGAPLDFVSWHWYTSDPKVIARSIDEVKAMLAEFPRLECETVIDEWNMSLGWEDIEPAFQPCFILETTREMMAGGLDLACYYHIRDYHVSSQQFAGFMSPEAVRFMTYWWNVMPQFHGLFDYQGTMRPSYFVFKMLSHMRGAGLAAESGAEDVRVLAAYDEEFEVAHILLWNWPGKSAAARRVKLDVKGLPGRRWRVYRRAFDAETASNDENRRLRLENIIPLDDADAFKDEFDLPPYAIAFIAVKRF